MSIQIKENVELAPLTTFKIGGAARYVTEVRTEEGIREALAWAREHDVRPVILAGGSNVLIPDQGLHALVIHIVEGDFIINGTELVADAGCNLLRLIKTTGQSGIGGWEKLSGIPGTIGGAVRGNAGAFGPEIKDFIVRVEALHIETGESKQFENTQCDFSYRHSFFKDNPLWIVTRVYINLDPVPPEESASLMKQTIEERERRHLQNVQAAGSFFMNPVAPEEVQQMFEEEKGVKAREGRVPAGWLIEKVGMKGYKIGDACASLQHPNYLVNLGKASAANVLELARQIKEAVQKQFNVELKEEAAILVNP